LLGETVTFAGNDVIAAVAAFVVTTGIGVLAADEGSGIDCLAPVARRSIMLRDLLGDVVKSGVSGDRAATAAAEELVVLG
jgi:hypothetical protein